MNNSEKFLKYKIVYEALKMLRKLTELKFIERKVKIEQYITYELDRDWVYKSQPLLFQGHGENILQQALNQHML